MGEFLNGFVIGSAVVALIGLLVYWRERGKNKAYEKAHMDYSWATYRLFESYSHGSNPRENCVNQIALEKETD